MKFNAVIVDFSKWSSQYYYENYLHEFSKLGIENIVLNDTDGNMYFTGLFVTIIFAPQQLQTTRYIVRRIRVAITVGK